MKKAAPHGNGAAFTMGVTKKEARNYVQVIIPRVLDGDHPFAGQPRARKMPMTTPAVQTSRIRKRKIDDAENT
jgi:hypothetical protein